MGRRVNFKKQKILENFAENLIYIKTYLSTSFEKCVKMTKLTEWLSLLVILASVWYGILTQNFGDLATDHPILTFWWPIGLIIMCGISSLFVIIHRVITFNDCEEAAEELQKQIQEAKEDLKR